MRQHIIPLIIKTVITIKYNASIAFDDLEDICK